jgi:TolB protein
MMRSASSEPRWNLNGHVIVYEELANTGHHTIVERDLTSGAAHRFTTSHTLNTAPTFSPDGNTIVFASGNDGTDLYSVPSSGGTPSRIMVGNGTTNTSPTFSPDGRQVAFTSGRLGHPEVYIMDADGSNPDLLTAKAFGDQLYRASPDWSPDGRTVAFQSQISGVFQIMSITVRDRNVIGLTSEGRNEEPSWAPDGRHLLFTSTRTGTKQLWVLDTESGRTRQLTHGSAAREGAWSPRLDSSK